MVIFNPENKKRASLNQLVAYRLKMTYAFYKLVEKSHPLVSGFDFLFFLKKKKSKQKANSQLVENTRPENCGCVMYTSGKVSKRPGDQP